MSAIKRFFQKKKMDMKFKKAGDGHKLNEDTRSKVVADGLSRPHTVGSPTRRPLCSDADAQMMATTSSMSRPYAAGGPATSKPQHSRQESSESAKRAGEAALSRLTSPRPGTASGTTSIKAQVRREIEAEQKALQQAQMQAPPKEIVLDAAPVLSVSGVFFKCPMAGPAVLPKLEMESYIETFLLNQLAEEPEMASALMIHTFNKDPDKAKLCIETLVKYLDNVIGNPGEEKYRKIRIGNKAFQERVASIKGTDEFLQSVGFVIRKQPFQDGEVEFYVLSEEGASNVDRLKEMREILLNSEPIRPELDHGLQVFYPSQMATKFELPDEFYNMTAEEVKREQQARTEAVEKLGMLRTKEMRERDRQRALRRYRYTLLRIRMPDGYILQGTFRAMDKLGSVIAFVRESLSEEWLPFILSTSTGQKLLEEDMRLAELELVPATVLNLAFDPEVLADMAVQHGSHQREPSLKPEILASVQSL